MQSQGKFFAKSEIPTTPLIPLLVFGDDHLSTITNDVLINLIPQLKKLSYSRYYGEFQPSDHMKTPQQMLDHLQRILNELENKSEKTSDVQSEINLAKNEIALYEALKKADFHIRGADTAVDALQKSKVIMKQQGGASSFYSAEGPSYINELQPLIDKRDKAMTATLNSAAFSATTPPAFAKIGAIHLLGIEKYTSQIAAGKKLTQEEIPFLYFYLYTDKKDSFITYVNNKGLKETGIIFICTQDITQDKVAELIINTIQEKMKKLAKKENSSLVNDTKPDSPRQ